MTDQIVSRIQIEDHYVKQCGEKNREKISKILDEIGWDNSWRIYVSRYIRDRMDGIKEPIEKYKLPGVKYLTTPRHQEKKR
jgi:hypothetical protein